MKCRVAAKIMEPTKGEQGNLKKNLLESKPGNTQSKENGKAEKNATDPEKQEEPGGEGRKVKVQFENACNRLGINPNLFFLKISLFVMYGGEMNQLV